MFNRLGPMVDILAARLSEGQTSRRKRARERLAGHPTLRGKDWYHRDRLDRTVLPVLYLPIWVVGLRYKLGASIA